MSIPLSECPFCKKRMATIKPALDKPGQSYVGCNSCKARGPVIQELQGAIAHWNYVSDNPWIRRSKLLQENLKKISQCTDLEEVMEIAKDTLETYGVDA